MYCPKCGTLNEDSATKCFLCEHQLKSTWGKSTPRRYAQTYVEPQSYDIPNHLIECVLVTIFCSLLFGAIGWHYASTVNRKLDAGDISGARTASDNAMKCIYAAFIVNAVAVVAWFIFGGHGMG
jgi:hypothetical protein